MRNVCSNFDIVGIIFCNGITSLPSDEPNPPSSTKSRCISMISNAGGLSVNGYENGFASICVVIKASPVYVLVESFISMPRHVFPDLSQTSLLWHSFFKNQRATGDHKNRSLSSRISSRSSLISSTATPSFLACIMRLRISITALKSSPKQGFATINTFAPSYSG